MVQPAVSAVAFAVGSFEPLGSQSTSIERLCDLDQKKGHCHKIFDPRFFLSKHPSCASG
jgi:hypothetical protein